MNELDEVWLQMMSQAQAQAQSSGRSDVAEYLALKANNDILRSTSCQWLFNSFLELSEEVNRQGIRLEIETENPHRFTVGNSTMVGSLLQFRQGVRCLTIETGWTRTPSDGFMRGGSLAHAKISHFGISKANAEILLLRNKQDAPYWAAIDKEGNKNIFAFNDLRKHFEIFLG